MTTAEYIATEAATAESPMWFVCLNVAADAVEMVLAELPVDEIQERVEALITAAEKRIVAESFLVSLDRIAVGPRMSNYSHRALRRVDGVTQSALFTGRVMYWSRGKGFGFVGCDDGRADIFAHIMDVVANVDALRIGQRVSVAVGIDSRSGWTRAIEIHLDD